MNNRPQSAVEFRAHSGGGSGTDNGGVSLHINHRVRTSRASVHYDTPVGLSPSIRENEPDSSLSETVPLLKDSTSSSTGVGFSHSVSQENPNSLTASLRLQLLDSLTCSPVDKWKLLRHCKIVVLFAITILCCGVIMLENDESISEHYTVLPKGEQVVLESSLCESDRPNVRLAIIGPFNDPLKTNGTGLTTIFRISTGYMFNLTINKTALSRGEWVEVTKELTCIINTVCNLTAESEVQIPLSWSTHDLSWQLKNEVVYAFLVLAYVYILIIFELVHRTLAALLGSLAALAVLASLKERPSLEVIVQWIDMETLTLLFGMMIIVAIFSETGFFDYSALKAYKLAKGKIWPLITLLCVFSAIVSAFLDNVTTILLMAPVTIRLCEVLNLDPRRILIAEVLFCNIGGTATAIGDPPNVIIVGALQRHGITFSVFTAHMAPGILFICVVGYGLLRLYYKKMDGLRNKDPPDITEMKHEIAMWRRTASRMQTVTREETLMRALFLQKAVEIEHKMNKQIHKIKKDEEQDMKETIHKLERQYYIKDYILLMKSGIVLFVVILFLFMYSFVESIYLDIGWIAVLGAIFLLLLADVDDIESVLHKVEWSTLLFFAALFVLMEALAELSLIDTIGDWIAEVITSVDEEHRLVLAVVVILWVSAIASSFIDNIPYTTAMVPVLKKLNENPDVNLPLVPLVVSLAFGACLGGNGTLIGASCNVVCAGIAEQHGYGFSFREFFKIGFPMMLVTVVAATAYVLLCHVAIGWNYV